MKSESDNLPVGVPPVPGPRRLDLRDETLNRAIISLAIPAILETLMFTVLFFSDTLIVGWLHDENALAAVGLAATLIWFSNAPFHALAIAATSLVARSWGEHRFEAARRYGGQSVGLAFLFSLVVMGVGLPLAEGMLRAMGGTFEVARLGSEYLRIILLSSVLGLPMIISNGIIRGTGDTKTPMYITLVMNALNILISLVLAYGWGPLPALGLAGVGWGTMVARTLGGLLSFSVLVSGRGPVHVPWSAFYQWRRSTAGRVLDLASPAMLERFLTSGAHVVFTAIVALLGTTALAAHNIALRVESLAFMPAMGVSVAVTTIVGQALGARRSHLAEAAVVRTLLWTGVIMVALGASFVLFAPQAVVIFGATPEVLRLAGIALQISALEHPLMAFVMILAGGLRGAGDTRSPLYVTLVCIVLFRFGLVYLFGIVLAWGLPGVWLATAVDWGGRSIGLWWVFKRGVWKLIHEETQDDELA